MNVQTLNPLEIGNWNEHVLTDENACIFHSAEWARTLHEAYGFTPRYLVLGESTGMQAALPLMGVKSMVTGSRGVSLPFSDSCRIIQRKESSNAAAQLLEAATALGRSAKWNYVEFRTGTAPAPDAIPFESHFTHTLNLTQGETTLFETFKSSVRRAIRKAEQSGLQVTDATSRAAVKAFYRLNCMTRRAHGIPPQPYGFFDALQRNVLEKGLGRVLLAERAGKVVAGAVFLHFGNQALFKYGASDRVYQEFRGNDLVMWEGIRRYCREGYKSLSLGRTNTSNLGLLNFKRGWGAEESPLAYFRVAPETEQFLPCRHNGAPVGHGLFRNMPISLLRICGTLLYRHVA